MGKKKSKVKAATQQEEGQHQETSTLKKNSITDKSSREDGGKIDLESSKGTARKVKISATTTTKTTKPVDDSSTGGRVKPSSDASKDEGKDDATERREPDETKKRPSAAAAATSTKATTKTTTKRQRLRQVNEKNRWTMPSPRIQTVEGRAKASIRIAVLSANQKLQHSKNNTLSPTLDLHSPEVKFGRLLGSVDERVRHQAVVQLKAYLKARCAIVDNHNNPSSSDDEDEEKESSSSSSRPAGLSEMDLLKLWKALWYTLYMADKVPVQEALSETIASLLWCVAGTEEEDEYAAHVYLRMCEDPFDDEDGEDDHDEQEEDDDDDVEGEDYTLEEVVNTLDEKENTGSDSDSSSDASSSDNDEMATDNQDREYDNELDEEDEIDDSEILHCRGAHLASLLIRTFFQTIRREWGRMDKYRVDKFYTLVRLVMHEVFVYMAKRHWHQGIIRLFNDAIYEQVLRETPNGLRYHVIDVTLHELAKVNANSKHCPMPLTEATLLEVLEPYFAMAQTGAGGDDSVQARVLENIVTKFLTHYSVARTETPRDEEDEAAAEEKKQDDKVDSSSNNKKTASKKSLVMDNVHVGTIGQYLFTIASDTDTLDKYRKSLYDVHKLYTRRLNEPGVQDVNIQVESDDDEEEEEYEEGDKVGQDDMEAVEMTAEARYDADVDTPERPARSTIKKKKKKSKAGAQAPVTDGEMAAQEEEEMEPVVVEKKKKSSKRSIEKVAASNDDEGEDADEGAEADNDTTEDDAAAKEKKKRKKKKRKKNERHEDPTGGVAAAEEEEVTISLKDQATARALLLSASKREQEQAVAAQQQQEKEQRQSKDNKKKKSRKGRDQDAAAADAAARQVKFAPVNHARSWKASMKGLLTMTPKIQPSPERGLLKKSTTKKTTKAANRKKAIDYF